MLITIRAGQTLRFSEDVTIEVTDPAPKRGPKSLPKSSVASDSMHEDILKMLGKRSMTSGQIRQKLATKYPGATTNAISWALVDLQYAGRRRNRKPAFGGPVVKDADGMYSLAA